MQIVAFQRVVAEALQGRFTHNNNRYSSSYEASDEEEPSEQEEEENDVDCVPYSVTNR